MLDSSADRTLADLRDQVLAQATQLQAQALRLETLEREQAGTTARFHSLGHWIQGGLAQHLTNVLLATGLLRRRLQDHPEAGPLAERIERYTRFAMNDTQALVDVLLR